MVTILDLMKKGDDPRHLFGMLNRLGIGYEVVSPQMLPTSDAIILPGSSHRITCDSLGINQGIYSLGIPILGICYGHQVIARDFGGSYGESFHSIQGALVKLSGSGQRVWMNHNDEVKGVPPEFCIIASTEHCRIAAMRHKSKPIYGVQFHPEQSPMGHLIFEAVLISKELMWVD